MNTFLSTGLAAMSVLTLCAAGASAATKAENFEQASARVKDNGYIVFAYADGWDRLSKGVCERLMSSESVNKAAGDAVFIPLGVPQFTGEKENKAIAATLGKLPRVKPESYPAIILYGPGCRHIATICGPAMVKADEADIAKRIAGHISAMKKQNALVEQAEKEKGLAKARLLGQAARVEGANRPDVMGKLKKADPKDETGYIRSLEFNPWGFTEKMLKYQVPGDDGKMRDATLDEILAALDAKLDEPGYTPEQRQVFCANAIGAIHRKGDVTKLGLMKKYAARMKELDPESTLGMAADVAVKAWAQGLTYEKGWNRSSLPRDNTPIELNGELPIREAGKYVVSFIYKGGNDALPIKGVRLYDGEKLIAEDMHEGNAGAPHNTRGNFYHLNVDSEVRDPHLFIIFGCDRALDTRGTINISLEK